MVSRDTDVPTGNNDVQQSQRNEKTSPKYSRNRLLFSLLTKKFSSNFVKQRYEINTLM